MKNLLKQVRHRLAPFYKRLEYKYPRLGKQAKPLSVILVFAVVGSLLLLLSHAAGTYGIIEAENGSYGGNVNLGTDNTAGLDRYAYFGTTIFNGYKGEYFANKTLSGSPVLTQDDSNISFNWFDGSPGAGIPTDGFSIRWTKNLTDISTNTYRFNVTTDDGVRLYIDNNLVIDKWIDQGTTTYLYDVQLTGGPHSMKMEYYENTGGAFASFSYSVVNTSPPPPPSVPPVPPTPPPDPLAISCQAVATAPNPFVGGITYTNWTFNTPGVSSIAIESDIRSPVATDAALYFQLYDGEASNGQGYYMGIQSSGVMLFSSFGNIDMNNLRTSPNSYAYAGTYEGPFLSLRVNMNALPVGKYTMRVTKAEYDGYGDWYNLYAQYDRTAPGQEVYLGGMRFPRSNASQPVFLRDWGGSWTEYFGNGSNPVPYYDVVNRVVEARGVNNELLSVKNVTFYFRPEYPNSDIKLLDWNTFATQQRAGGGTQRCHMNGNVK